MRTQPHRLHDVNIVSRTLLPTPERITRALPLAPALRGRVYGYRRAIRAILDRHDSRLLAIVGPCSIHDARAALEYARRLKGLADAVRNTLLVVMRVYFEKPRTTVGWKGLINDPFMDDSFHIEKGLRLARRFLIDLARLGLPAGTEALDPITPQYIGDLISWTAIGARTTESQTHREMASGLSTPVGFKNGTDGSIEVAINAIRTARHSHHFLGITEQGRSAVFHTRGNCFGHLILRGGRRPNYDARSLARCEAELKAAGLPPGLIVDCSHGNSGKDPARQPRVLSSLVRQVEAGSEAIVGFMMESYLEGGRQPIPADRRFLKPDVSVTDACLGWDETERAILNAHRRLGRSRARAG